MNAMQQRPRIRSVDTVCAAIEGQRRIIDHWVDLASDFLNVDMRPLVFDGHSAQRVGPSPVPDELIKMISDEKATLAALEGELYEAHQRERHYRY